ncbi:MutS-related protein [Anaerovibrio sp.]|uniref:MutS-related protein n=1 Tax=Anaerovibrio sp. TaxID=1872532 RepID=UPI0038903CF3
MELSYFEQLRRESLATIEGYKRKSQLFTTKRTLSFLALLVTVAVAYDMNSPWPLLAGILIFAYFFYLIRGHSRLHDDLNYEINRETVINDYISRFTDDWKKFDDTGEDFLDRNLTQDIDLNILGKASIYQFLNTARTLEGRHLLASRLSPEPVDANELKLRQEETGFFSNRVEDSIKLQAISRQIPFRHSVQNLLNYLKDRQHDPGSLINKLIFILPVAALIVFGAGLMNLISMEASIIIFIIQLGIALASLGKNAVHITPLYKLNKELITYCQLLYTMKSMLPEKMGRLDPAEIDEALKPIRTLGKLCAMAEVRHNFILLFALNALVLWDFHIVRMFISWQKEYGHKLEKWLNLWYEAEAAISLSVIGHIRPDALMPELLDDTTNNPHIEANELSHLLIPYKEAVPNSLTLNPSLNIITGSNMSGKTTWLRTLASSCILAYAGAPVCGKGFKLTPVHILTSIRVNDDLSSGISTFYAELIRIKNMIETANQDIPVLAVIDEIFKGTNSADRIVGAEAALKQLSRTNLITLVSTHDFELCHIKSEQVPVNNYHFEEHFQEDKILFDYTMKNGPCKTTNAQFLLKLVGIS